MTEMTMVFVNVKFLTYRETSRIVLIEGRSRSGFISGLF